MIRQGLRLLPRKFSYAPKYVWRYSTLPEASPDSSTALQSGTSRATSKSQRAMEFRNNVTIEGVMEEKCNYWKDENDHISSVSFNLKHQTHLGSVASFIVTGRTPGVIHFLLTKTDAGAKVCVKGKLIGGWRSNPEGLRILARNVKLNDTDSSYV